MNTSDKNVKKRNSHKILKLTLTYDIINQILGMMYVIFVAAYLIWYASTFIRSGFSNGQNSGLGWLWIIQTFGLFLLIPTVIAPILRLVSLTLSIKASAGHKKMFAAEKNVKISSSIRLVQLFVSFFAAPILGMGIAFGIPAGLEQMVIKSMNFTSAVPFIRILNASMIFIFVILMLIFLIKCAFEIIVSIFGFTYKDITKAE
ncbi:MAG: hypothetical protein K5654_06125 [Lachnospiraceae bacterium]|nr:hypothetical protein [Lachnospiraceae bacterium]